MIDRKNEYYFQQGLHFPVPNDETFQRFHIDTIVDGELVNDRLPDGKYQLNYLVFDCLILDGKSLMQRTLDKRLAYFQDKVYNPYKDLYRRFPEEVAYLPFIVRFKRMELSYGIEMMFRDILPNLPHGNDGLIFTAKNRPYRFGTDEHIVKWKPESENSIDFQLNLDFPWRDPDSDEEAEGDTEPKPDWDAKPTATLSVKHGHGDHRPYADMYMTDDEWERLKGMGRPLQETIVECAQDDQRRWRFLRFRDDKNDANHIRTVESVMESIQDRVGRRDLTAAAKKMKDEWKKREQEQQSTKRVESGEKSSHDDDDQRRRSENERRRLAEDALGKKRQQEDEYHRRQRPREGSQKTDDDDHDDHEENNNNNDVEEMKRNDPRRRSSSSNGYEETKDESRQGDSEESMTNNGGAEKRLTKMDDEVEQESDEDDEPEPIAYHPPSQGKKVTLNNINHAHDGSNGGNADGHDGPSPLKRKAEAEVEVEAAGDGLVDDDVSSSRTKRRAAGRGDHLSFDGASSSPPSVASVSKGTVEAEISSDEDEPAESHDHDGGDGGDGGSGGDGDDDGGDDDDDDDDDDVVENGDSQYTSSDTSSSA